MANNYSPCTIEPSIPKALLSETDIEYLENVGITCEPDRVDGADDYYYYYLYSEEGCALFGIPSEDPINAVAILQRVIRNSDIEYFTIEMAHTCSKMRPGEFGGTAYLITAKGVKSFSTSEWLDKEINKMKKNDGS